MSSKLKFEGGGGEEIIKSSLSHIVLLKNNYVSKCVAFYSFKNVQDWLYVEHYLLQQTMHSMLFCVTQNTNSSLGNTHVDHIL